MTPTNKSKVLIGLPAIAGYLSISEPTVRRYIAAGMPCNYFCNRWHFHVENVDLWFKALTKHQFRDIDPEKISENGDEN